MNFFRDLINKLKDSIQNKVFTMFGAMALVALGLSYYLVDDALSLRALAGEYNEMQQAAGFINEAAGWQAIERGIGATLLNSKKMEPGLLKKWEDVQSNGDKAVENGFAKLANVREILIDEGLPNEDIDFAIEQWKKSFAKLNNARGRLESRQITNPQWIADTTANIDTEFLARTIVFAPHEAAERLVSYNTVLRTAAAEVAEFAGRERAQLGSVIGAKIPITAKRREVLERMRFVLERNSNNLLAYSDLVTTTDAVRKSLVAYQKEFLTDYQKIREDIYAISDRANKDIIEAQPISKEAMFLLEAFLDTRRAELQLWGASANAKKLTKAVATGANQDDLRKAVEVDILALMEHQPFFGKVRFVDYTGKELVVVDNMEGNMELMRGKGLLTTPDDPSTIGGLSVKKGEVWTSELWPNQVGGKVVLPIVPIIEFATPLFYKGKLVAIADAHVFAKDMLDTLKSESIQTKGRYALVNRQGFYLHHSDTDKEMGFEKLLNRESENVKNDIPDIAKELLGGGEGVVSSANGRTYVYEVVHFLGELSEDNYWVLYSEMPLVNYPFTGGEWITTATNAINFILAVSETVGQESIRSQEEMVADANFALGQAGVAVLLVLIVAGVVYTFVQGSILRPINAIIGLFSEIGMGDYAARVEVTSTDELGTMAISLNAMLDNTLSLIQSSDEKDKLQVDLQNLLEDVAVVADGDLTQDARVSEGFTGSIADAVNFMIESLRDVIKRVQDSTLQVSSAANQIQVTTENLAESNNENALQIANASSAIDEMAVSIQTVSDNADTSAKVAAEALSAAKRGAEVVMTQIDGMGKIRERVQETSKRLKRLGESSQEIDDIVQLIVELADRTSILALNASIQAAMAGEHGKGFAVVASEVERLAERSTEATKQITRLVATIQSETNETIIAMEESTTQVVEGTKLADEAGRTLSEIEGVSIKLADLLNNISMAAKQQARGSEDLARTMADISGVTQNSASGTKEAAVSIKHLAELSDELRESVSAFKISADGAGA